jgi:UPF0271 protein
MKRIDINCDMGEQETTQGLKGDLEIMPFISSCNVSCGFHSGNPFIIEETIRGAIQYQIKIGAHPSYDDRENFGRLSLNVNKDLLRSQLKYQICAIKGMVESLGQNLNHVKPHGALYNDMAKDEALSKLFVDVIKEIDPNLKIYGMSESIFMEVCKSERMLFVKEGFADRRYASKAELRSRKLEHSVLTDPKDVLRHIGFLLNGKVELFSGEIEPLKIDTICVHSDTEGAATLCQLIHEFITNKEIAIG